MVLGFTISSFWMLNCRVEDSGSKVFEFRTLGLQNVWCLG